MIFLQYTDYTDVFSEKNVKKLLLHQDSDYAINIKSYKSLYNLLYNLSKTELQILREYLDNILIKK